VTSHVSHPYKSTDFTQTLKILILVSFCIDVTQVYHKKITLNIKQLFDILWNISFYNTSLKMASIQIHSTSSSCFTFYVIYSSITPPWR
jgi:hypothetical protein